MIGASGYVGGAIVARLSAAGLHVSGLSRSEASDQRVADAGAIPVRGDTGNLGLLRHEAKESDFVVYASINNPGEHQALHAIVGALESSNKPLIFTSGATIVAEATVGHFSARQFGENDPFVPPEGSVRLSSEEIVVGAAARGVRSMIVRPPLVYGHGGSVQIPRFAQCGLKTGSVRFIGPGENMWAVVHVDDLAEMYVRLLQDGRAGQVYHVSAGEVTMGDLARAVAQTLGVPAASASVDEAEAWYGTWGARVGMSSSCRPIAPIAEAHLKWRPRRADIIEDVTIGSYANAWSNQS